MGRKPRESTLPKTLKQLTAWLRDTTEGQRVMAEHTSKLLEEKCRACQAEIKQKPKVLVVARRLGQQPGAEVYAERGVSVRLEEMFDTADDPQLEVAAEEALAIRLPRSWQHLLTGIEPKQPVKGVAFKGVTLREYVYYLEMERTVKGIKDVHGELTKSAT